MSPEQTQQSDARSTAPVEAGAPVLVAIEIAARTATASLRPPSPTKVARLLERRIGLLDEFAISHFSLTVWHRDEFHSQIRQ